METVYQKIAAVQSEFSQSLLKVTSHFYEDPKIFATYSAKKAGIKMGVSETSIIRFCQKLGYSGYREMQKEIREKLLKRNMIAEFAEDKRAEFNQQPPSIKTLITKDMADLKRVSNMLCENLLQKIVSVLSASDHVLVAGTQTSFAMGNWFAYALNFMMGKTQMLQMAMDDIGLRIQTMTKSSVLVAFSFELYGKETIEVAKLAQEQGVFVLAITDSPVAPITRYANLTLPIQLHDRSTIDLMPIVMSVIKSIVLTVSLQNTDQFSQRMAQLDQINDQNFYI